MDPCDAWFHDGVFLMDDCALGFFKMVCPTLCICSKDLDKLIFTI